MLFFANNIWAYNFSAVHNGTTIYYNITNYQSPYTVEVTYRTTSYNSYSGSVTIPDSVTYNGVTYSVTGIGDFAFYNCTRLTSVTIPNSVRNIGSYIGSSNSRGVFSRCSNLSSVCIPDSITIIYPYTFQGCTSLTSVTIPNSVIEIGESAFYDCTGLTSVTIPNSVTAIRNYAFSGCTNLTSVIIGNSVISIWDYAFENCRSLATLTIPNSVIGIGESAFYGCSGLRRTNYLGTIAQWCNIYFGSVNANPVSCSHNLYINNQLITNLVIPNTVDTINKYAFCVDTCITSVTIPNSVTAIGISAFSGCTGLTSVTIPNSVTCIGEGVFSGCAGLTSVTIPNSVTSLGNSAFSGCTVLTSVTIPNSVTSIGASAFSGCTGLTSVTIPNSVTSIGASAFSGCTGLTSVTIPNSVTRIGNSAFYSCTGLSTVNFNADSCVSMGIITIGVTIGGAQISGPVFQSCPNFRTLIIGNNVSCIPAYAFAECSALDSVTIPNSVTRIGNSAFSGCTGLSTVNFNADSCVSMGHITAGGLQVLSGTVFQRCSNFRTLIIGNSVSCIPAYAFAECSALDSVTIPNSVTSIGEGAFIYCTGLTRTNYTGTIAQWCDIDFESNSNPVFFSGNLYINNQLITNLVIPNTVETIKQYAFIGDTSITSVTIPNSVTSIGKYAFYGCTGLTSVTIPDSVTSIGNYAFYSCSGLTSITFHRANTMIDTDAFGGLPVALPIHIPCGSSAWYINKLPNFSNFIEELQYSYLVTSQDTVKGSVATVTAPTCNSSSWTIRATANNGYTFSHWSDGDTNTQRTLTVNRDTTLVAYFVSVQPWYSFSVVSEDTLKGTVQIITQPSQANPQATFVAVPNTGYTFSRWSDGNTQNPRPLTVTQDTALVAYFTANTPQWYSFSVVSEDTLKGSVQIITQPSQVNPQATFVALPNTGYTFSRWSDGNTQNPRSITVTQDTILIAFFTSTQGIAKAENVSITIYPNPASETVTIEGVGNETNIFIINSMGKVVRRLENAGGTITFSVGDLPKGIYFVRVGNAVCRFVVD